MNLKAMLVAHRNTVLFAAAIGCGAIAVVAGKGYLAQQLEAERVRLTPKPSRTIDVVVARRDVDKGDLVSPQTMALRSIPAEFASSSAIRPDQFDGFNGMRLAVPLRGGEQLVATAIVGGEHMTFSHRVKPGIRALTIAVDEINSISGMLQPGDRIDLLFSARPPGDGPARSQVPEATLPLFQSLLVLATGKQVRAGVDERGAQRSFSTVTVEVEPEHAQRLVVAQRAGKLTAVLRNPDDPHRMARKSMDIRQLLETPATVVAVRRAPQMIVGGVGRVPGYSSSASQSDPRATDAQPGQATPSIPAPAPVSASTSASVSAVPELQFPVEPTGVGPAGRAKGFDTGDSDAPRRIR